MDKSKLSLHTPIPSYQFYDRRLGACEFKHMRGILVKSQVKPYYTTKLMNFLGIKKSPT